MKYLLNHSIYSEGKYPSFVNFNPSDLLTLLESSSYSLLGIDPISREGGVGTFEDTIVSVNLPTGKLNILASLGGSDAFSTESGTTRGIVDYELISTPIKIGDTNLNNIYLESKDHSKYVKLTWMPRGEEIDSTRYYLSEFGVDLSWFHYISYRDEEGIFKGNILEFCPFLLLLLLTQEVNKNMSSVSWREVLDNMNNTLMFVRPKDDPIDFVWGKIDSSIKETPTDNLLLTPILFDLMAS